MQSRLSFEAIDFVRISRLLRVSPRDSCLSIWAVIGHGTDTMQTIVFTEPVGQRKEID